MNSIDEAARLSLNQLPLRDAPVATPTFTGPRCGTCFHWNPSRYEGTGRGWCDRAQPYMRITATDKLCNDHCTLNMDDDIVLTFPVSEVEAS